MTTLQLFNEIKRVARDKSLGKESHLPELDFTDINCDNLISLYGHYANKRLDSLEKAGVYLSTRYRLELAYIEEMIQLLPINSSPSSVQEQISLLGIYDKFINYCINRYHEKVRR